LTLAAQPSGVLLAIRVFILSPEDTNVSAGVDCNEREEVQGTAKKKDGVVGNGRADAEAERCG
jgi:hypothetical protein